MSNEKKGLGADNAPGQLKSYTLIHPDGREPITRTQAEIRTQREQLKAEGWTGHGLDDDEPVAEEGTTAPTGEGGESK